MAQMLAGLHPVIVKIAPPEMLQFMFKGLLLLFIGQGLIDEYNLSIRDSFDDTLDTTGERNNCDPDIVDGIVHSHHLHREYRL